jgi:hypothetical protein
MDDPSARSNVGCVAPGAELEAPAQPAATRANPPAAMTARRPALGPVVRPLVSSRWMPRVLAYTENLRSSVEYV